MLFRSHDFRPTYIKISSLKRFFPNIPVMALTATADKVTCEDIIRQLNLRSPKIFLSSFDRPNLSLSVKKNLDQKEKLSEILDFISCREGKAGIIYCMSRKSTEMIAAQLEAYGYDADVYHAGLSNEERERNQHDFLTGKTQIMCATIAFGMGIDKSDVRWVIHYNLPKSMECYYQEIGRAGRDGRPSDTMLFYSLSDMMILTKFAEESGQKEINGERLKRMQQYAESTVCRRRNLLSYFGENTEKDCGNCDVCKNPPEKFDGTLIAQKALSAIVRCNQMIGVNLLIDILRGSHKLEIVANGYDKIKTYGAGKDISHNSWELYLLQMLHLGYFEIVYNKKNVLCVTSLGWKVLKGEHSVLLNKENVSLKQKKQTSYFSTVKPKSALEQTLMLATSGMKAEEIARTFNIQTITGYSHLTQLYTDGNTTFDYGFIMYSGVDWVKQVDVRFH